MNIICKLFGHKTITKKYGNKFGSGMKTSCSRCKYNLWDFHRQENLQRIAQRGEDGNLG